MIHINLLPRKRKSPKPAKGAGAEKKSSSERSLGSLLPLLLAGAAVYVIGSFAIDYMATTTKAQRDQAAVTAMQAQNAKLTQQVQPREAALAGQDVLLAAVGGKTNVSATLALLVQRLPVGAQLTQITLDKSACTLNVVLPSPAAEDQFLQGLNRPPFSSPSYQSSSQDAKGSVVLTNVKFAILPTEGGS